MTRYEQEHDAGDVESLALAVFRQSKGSDDSASLAEQRERVPMLAKEHADAVEVLDMGVHTGYSRHNRESDEPHVEASDAYMEALEAVERGRYDVVAAYDENRIARDKFIERWEYAAERGEATFVFEESNPDDALAAGVKRVVEREAKKREIEKARRAVERRTEAGHYQGGPWKGTEFDAAGEYLVPAEDDEWEAVMTVVERWDGGEEESKRGLARETGLPRTTVRRVIDRIEEYRALADGARIGNGGRVVWPDGGVEQSAADD